jgi:hypothetical protein
MAQAPYTRTGQPHTRQSSPKLYIRAPTNTERLGADVAQRRDFEPQPGVPLPPEQKAVADHLLAESVADIGAPTLAHYRDVYANLGLDWPGDTEIRALYPVADGVLSR